MNTGATISSRFAATVLMSAALALPAAAQVQQAAINSRVLMPAPAHVYSLTTNLVGAAPTVQNRTWTGLVRNLKIEALPSDTGTTTFGVGPGARCAYGGGNPDDPIVEFHNANGTYSRGRPIAEACRHWGPAKCSRTVTVDLREQGHGMRTYTVNAGYPRCPSSWGDNGAPALGSAADDIPDSRQDIRANDGTRNTHKGIFKVRIWGNFCLGGGRPCYSLKDYSGRPLPIGATLLHLAGYGATFRSSSNCGPARHATPQLQAASAPAFAEWCDVTVDVRR